MLHCGLRRAVNEIQNLRQEAKAVRELRATLNLEGAARRVFDKVRRPKLPRRGLYMPLSL